MEATVLVAKYRSLLVQVFDTPRVPKALKDLLRREVTSFDPAHAKNMGF